MPIKVIYNRKPEEIEKKANEFLAGKYLIGIAGITLPDFKDSTKSYGCMFIAYK